MVTKNIEHVIPFDDNYIGLEDFNAIGILDGIVYCHYTDERKPYFENSVKEQKYNTYKITNDEIMIVNNEEILII